MNDLEFPPFPSVEATWVPIYAELIPCSGERITLGVAAWAKGDFKHALAISGQKADLILGEATSLLSENFYRVCELLADAVALPFQLQETYLGLFVGNPRHGLGDSLDDVLDQALSLSSSFYQGHLRE
ncbi:TPA: hypothetical protein ACSPMB_000304 [Pseudomonas aeruginosa]